MLYNGNRADMRDGYFIAWQAYKDNQPLEPVQQQIVDVIRYHPQYFDIFDHPDEYRDKEYSPHSGETNPFLHLAVHLVIRDQVATDKPVGIRKLYQKHLANMDDAHNAEHGFMYCMSQILHEMQSTQTPFNEHQYFAMIRKMMKQKMTFG